MSMSEYYIQLPLETDPQEILDDMVEYIQGKIPGWEAGAANLDTIMLQALAVEASDLREVAASVPLSIFRYFGNSLVGLPPVDASPATTLTNWTMRDTAGYTIDAGTLVGVRTSGDTLVTFEVQDSFTINPGSSTATNILVVATTPGVDGSGLGSAGFDMELVEPILEFVTLIEMVSGTTGGVDAETDIEYLSRLRAELQLLAPRPILPIDFSVLAARVAGVERSITLDGYNPADNSFGNERMATIFSVDTAGEAVSAPVKAEIDALLEGMRELNFIVHTDDPVYTTVDVNATVRRKPGFDNAVVDSAVTQAITDYLSPADWGRQDVGGDVELAQPVDWINRTVLRHYELVSEADQVEGVDYVETLTMRVSPAAFGTTNITLGGDVSMPRPGTITVTVTDP